MNFSKISAALAGLSLAWGSAFAQSDPVQVPELPNTIIIEVQPGQSADSESAAAEQAMIGMLLMQLLGLQPESDQQELQIGVPNADPGVGI